MHCLKKEAKHELQTAEVEDCAALMKELRGLAEKSFEANQFKMVSMEEGEALLEDGDDLEAEIEGLEGAEFHIKVEVSVSHTLWTFVLSSTINVRSRLLPSQTPPLLPPNRTLFQSRRLLKTLLRVRHLPVTSPSKPIWLGKRARTTQGFPPL